MSTLRESPRTVNATPGFPDPDDRAAWNCWWRQLLGLARLAARLDPRPPVELILRPPGRPAGRTRA
jgi:hypothetical protein